MLTFTPNAPSSTLERNALPGVAEGLYVFCQCANTMVVVRVRVCVWPTLLMSCCC
jgi:hypothetical protein